VPAGKAAGAGVQAEEGILSPPKALQGEKQNGQYRHSRPTGAFVRHAIYSHTEVSVNKDQTEERDLPLTLQTGVQCRLFN